MNLTKHLLTALGLIMAVVTLLQMDAAQAAPAPKPPEQSNTVVISDEDFDLNNWDVNAEVNGQGTYDFRQESGGGDQYGIVEVEIPPVPQLATYSVIVTGLYSQQSYDPSQQGAITSIDFDLATRLTEGNWPDPFANVYLAAVQNSRIFYATPGVNLQGINNNWQQFTTNGLQAWNFAAWDGFPGNPNFSENGAPITFGFLTGMSRIQTSPPVPPTSDLRLQVDIDAWQIEINRGAPPTGADLQMTSCCTGGSKEVGTQDIFLRGDYNYTITNLGPWPATNVVVSVPQVHAGSAINECEGGVQTPLTCTFDRLEPGESVEVEAYFLANRATGSDSYVGTFGMSASVTADEPDPDQDNNSVYKETSFYDCDFGCFIEAMFCARSFGGASVGSQSALGWIGHVTATAQSAFIPDLPFYYDLRTLMLTRADGVRYNALYNTHNQEVFEIIALDPSLWDSALTTLELWEPNLRALTEDQGGTAVLTAEQITALDTFLTDIAAEASPELAQAIADERAKLPAPDEFVGQTMAEAAETALGGPAQTVYLPLVVK